MMNKLLPIITLIFCSTSVGDDPPAVQDTATPLDVIADCVDAAQQRDFRRYVDHLSPDEQKLQSGVVVWIQSSGIMAVNTGEADETLPGDRLLMYVLNDLRKKHSVPDSNMEGGQTLATVAVAAMQGEVESDVVRQVGAEYFPQGVQAPVSGRQLCMRSAETLKDPAAFLVEALEEIFRPTVVSGKRPKTSVDTLSLTDVIADVCKPFEELEFTLYTRGEYAIAIAELPAPPTAPDSPEPQLPAPPLAPSTLPYGAVPTPASSAPQAFDPYGQPHPYGQPSPYVQSAAPNCETGLCRLPERASSSVPNQVTILFRRMDGQWKITELFPIQGMF